MPGVRVPITNINMQGDYTAAISVGRTGQAPLNVIVDTGSSALAVDGAKYRPDLKGGDRSTNLAQTDVYGDQSAWTGAIIETTVSIGSGPPIVAINVDVAVAYQDTQNMFRGSDGILGLAYAPLDDAFQMPNDTWQHHYTATQVRAGKKGTIVPFLTQLAEEGVPNQIAFYTRRSFVQAGGAGNVMNQGWMIVGGGAEADDLYEGPLQSAKVVSDSWYCTNLTSVAVGDTARIAGRLQGPMGMPSNSIIDTGTNSLNLGLQLLEALISQFSPSQQALLMRSIRGEAVENAELDLATWPTITFTLEGQTAGADVELKVPPSNYWQLDAGVAGQAVAAITPNQQGLAILGLPIMAGYFTIFDGEADDGRGAVLFGIRKPTGGEPATGLSS